MDEQNTPKDFPEERKLRGLYRHVKISVKTLDRIILVGIAAIVLVLIFAVGHSGYTITFDSKGGTDVAAQDLRYGDVIQEPQAPTREGYVFDGWYADEGLSSLWDFDTAVEGSMTLYAGWTQNP
jgi:uncharacterized repeat protein (TIGR02543 family)